MDYQTQESLAFLIGSLDNMAAVAKTMRQGSVEFQERLQEMTLPRHGERRRPATTKAMRDFIKASEKMRIAVDGMAEGLKQDLMEARH